MREGEGERERGGRGREGKRELTSTVTFGWSS